MNITAPHHQQQQRQQVLDRNKIESIVNAMKTFDDQRLENNKMESSFEIKAEEARVLEELPEHNEAFFKVPYRDVAGLKTTDGDIENKSHETHYIRDEVNMLWHEIDVLPENHILVIQGQPGIGKSTAVWKKILEMAHKGDNILWVTLSRLGGGIAAVYFQGAYYYEFELNLVELQTFFKTVPLLDTVVVDGLFQNESCINAFNTISRWRKKRNTKNRAIFTASTNVIEVRGHQPEQIRYFNMHSWSIEDFRNALVQGGQPTALFDTCAELFSEENDAETLPIAGINISDDNAMDSSETGSDKISADDIYALIDRRYHVSGGSARWMFNYKKDTMERLLRKFANSAPNRQAILDQIIGPTSNVATNYFFGSSRKRNGETEYFLVSQRAAEILGEHSSVYPVLYDFAKKLENPLFLDWIVKADFFSQVDQAIKMQSRLRLTPLVPLWRCAPFKPIFTQAFDHTKNKSQIMILNLEKARLERKNAKKSIGNAISQLFRNISRRGESVCCKPTKCQVGCDAFFVEFVKKKIIHLRFCLITKVESRTLKGGFYETVVEFFEKAGYTVKSVEIAFVLSTHNAHSFSVKGILEGFKNLKDYSVFGAFKTTKWGATQTAISRNVAQYKFNLTE